MATTPLPTRSEKCFLDFDGFRVDPIRRRLLRDGETVPLTPKAFALLLVLIENRGEVMEKEELIQRVWPDTYVTEANLTQNISSLRKALGERANNHRCVVTVPGRGYSFVADVVEVPRDSTGEFPSLSDTGSFQLPVLREPTPTPLPPQPAVLEDTATGDGTLSRLAPVLEPPAALPPLRGRRRFLLAGLVLGLLLAATFGAGYSRLQKKAAQEAGFAAPLEGQTRPVVAVMGFRSLAADRSRSWLGTALAEMLITELSAGSEVRMVSGEEVSRVRTSLSLPYTEDLGGERLRQIQDLLGADLAVVGSYLALGDEAGGKIRVDLRVIKVPEGETLASLAEVGTEEEVFELVTRVGQKLRRSLGWSEPSAEETRAAQALQPSNPEAARLYAEGLLRLRAFDSRGARDLLELAAETDPKSAVIRSALSLAWMGLGYDAQAREEAAEALRLSASLPKEVRLATEARLYEAEKSWSKAAEIYRSLWTFYPDNLEYGLRLASTLSAAGRGADALSAVGELRKLPSPEGDDPRIDLVEAQIAKRLSSFVIQQRAAKSAEEKGRKLGESQVVAQALMLQGDGLLLVGQPQQAVTLFEEARGLFERSGNQGAVAVLLTHFGVALHEQGELREAEAKYNESLAALRRIGSIQGVAMQLANLGLLYQDQGDINRSLTLLEEAHAAFAKGGDRVLGARALNALGTVYVSRGDLAGGRERFEQTLAISRQTGNRTDEARALHYLGLNLGRQGAWREAQRLHDEAYNITLGLKDPSRAASMLAGSAEAHARMGDLAGARIKLQQALAMKQRARDKIGYTEVLTLLAQLEYRQGNLAKAREHSQNQLRLAREMGSRSLAAWALQSQSRWLLEGGDLATARRQLQGVARERAEMGDALEAASARLALAEVELLAGQSQEAARQASELAAWYGARAMSGHQARALAVQARALLAQGRGAQAEQVADQAHALSERSEDVELRIEVFTALAPVSAASGSPRAAMGHLRWAMSEAQRLGFRTAELQARVALGQLQLGNGEALAGRSTLEAVQRDAKAKGFLSLAQQAGALLQGTRLPLG